MEINKILRFAYNKVKLSFLESKFEGRLKYIYETNNSDRLIIVFSGFAYKVPKYNYMRTLRDVSVDKLFILDDFGCRGSYYWFENGSDRPLNLTKGLISKIIKDSAGRYRRIYTAGSSKGGTCAIYYGLLFNVDCIFAGACQYHIGSYLSTEKHRKVLEGMMGKNANRDDVKYLDSVLPDLIDRTNPGKTSLHLLYSKDEIENTYQDHMKDLIYDLKTKNFDIHEIEDHYRTHDENGIYFSKYLRNYFMSNEDYIYKQ